MSEPVGNGPRTGAPLPGSNSHSARAAAEKATAPPEEREKVEQVVHGKVVQRKPNVFKRVARGMVADDVTNVGDFVVAEVFLPALRNLMYDIVSQGTHRVLFGTARSRRTGVGAGYGYAGPVTNLKTAYNRVSQEAEQSRSISREDQARHNFDELILQTHADAMEVLENLAARVDRYGSASVADLYDYLGVTGGFTDQKYGWTNLANADVRQTRRGFVLDLPRPIVLR
jgi:hypothetical protein